MTSTVVNAAENKLSNQPGNISFKAVLPVMLAMDNAGNNWTKIRAPISVTLTFINFASSNIGWIVGHGGVVFRTTFVVILGFDQIIYMVMVPISFIFGTFILFNLYEKKLLNFLVKLKILYEYCSLCNFYRNY